MQSRLLLLQLLKPLQASLVQGTEHLLPPCTLRDALEGAVCQIPSKTLTDLPYLPGQRGAGDSAGTAICPQAAQHISGTSTLAGLPPAVRTC